MVKAYENTIVTTRSHPDAFPSALKLMRTTQTLVHESADLGTKVSQRKESGSWYLSSLLSAMKFALDARMANPGIGKRRLVTTFSLPNLRRLTFCMPIDSIR